MDDLVVVAAVNEVEEDSNDGGRPSVVPRKELLAPRMFSFPSAYITPRHGYETRVYPLG